MNKKLKVILGLLLFLYFTTYLFSLAFSKKQHADFHERVIVAIASPMQRLVNFSYEQVSSIFSNYFMLVGTSKKNEILQKENEEFRQKLINANELEQENERLRALLQLPKASKYDAIHAERIAFATNEFERSITINKGADDQIRIGMPVVNSQGIVGQVAEVYKDYSNLLLLNDKSSAIDVIIQRTRSRGTLKGFTQHQLSFEFLSVDEDLQVGDVVISSGLDGVYPDSVPIGFVSALSKQGRRLFLSATVDPYVNFSKVEEVRVLASKDGR